MYAKTPAAGVPVVVAVAVTVGVAGGLVGVAVGVAHVQQLELVSQRRTSPSSQVDGFCTHCPQVDARQRDRTVGQGSPHWSEQYGVPVGAQVGVSVAVPMGRGVCDGVTGVEDVRVGLGLNMKVGDAVAVAGNETTVPPPPPPQPEEVSPSRTTAPSARMRLNLTVM